MPEFEKSDPIYSHINSKAIHTARLRNDSSNYSRFIFLFWIYSYFIHFNRLLSM